MKKFFFWGLLLSLNVTKLTAQSLSIVPLPVEMKELKGKFTVNATTLVGANNAEAAKIARMFVEKFGKASGMTLKTGAVGQIQFVINAKPNAKIGDEGYTLDVMPSNVKITANKPVGLFYGYQTLLQLLPKEIGSASAVKRSWTIPSVQIVDYPRFGWRSMMLDVSRHFFSKEDVKRYIDGMAQFKYNVFHWHLTDDNGWRIEIKSLPELTKVGGCRVPRYGKWGNHEAPKAGEPATDCGYYTQEDIKEIVAYAAERHVKVLPEIDVPGHSAAAIASYQYLNSTEGDTIYVSPGHNFAEWYGNGQFKMLVDNALNPADERVYQFLDKVFTEVAALFPSEYVHVGGDECYHGYWEKNEACVALMKKENLKNTHELQSYFIKRVEKILKSKGKKTIGWDEILEGGLAPEAAIMSWRGNEGGIEAAKQGHYAVMTPNDFTYTDLIQGDPLGEPDATSYKTVRLTKAYAYEPVPEGVDSKYILGGGANLWSEKIPTIRHAEYMTYPRAWALADTYWSPKGTKNWNKFIERIEKQFDRADISGLNYARSAFDPMVSPRLENGKLLVDVTAEVNGLDVYYTLDETTPDKYTHKYAKSIEVPAGPVTLKVVTYRGDKQVGRIIAIPRETLLKRVK